MRIENVGSLSPAADMLAFFIAIMLTLGALMTLDIGKKEETGVDHSSLLEELTDSSILDPDDDGSLEVPDEDSFAEGPIPHGDSIYTRMEWPGGEFEMIIVGEQFYHAPMDHDISSSIHSVTVLMDIDGKHLPGLLHVSEMEVEK